MMKVSTKSTYAIKALIDLIHDAHEGPVRLPDIAQRKNIPLPYLEQIFSKLTRAGIVISVRGPKGGYQLAKNPKEVSLVDIVTVLEGPLEPVLCSQPENKSPDCHDVKGCLSRAVCYELDNELNKVLSRNTLETMSKEAEKLNIFHP
ncbi:MAG: Rrf2 family transcriptional regulator [Elusimicrobia bacterium]|nr:Rrf2 family transcriptional regulator [Candidatus Obscuribacterium magneticum]